MPRYLRNRSTKEIVAFLLAHGFLHSNTVGDDDIYVKNSWPYPVKVTQNRKSTPIGTMQSIKRWSGYKSKEWVKWWKENGYGE